MDERLEECLAGRHGAVGERLCDVVPHRRDLAGVGRARRGVLHGGDQFLTPGTQVSHLGGEAFEALAALGLGQRAGLERREVALDRVLGLGDPGVDDGQLLVVVGPLGACPAPGGCDGLVEQVGALVGVEERVEDGGVQVLGRQAFGVAVRGPVALASGARVVAVPVAVAHGRGPDEVRAAAGTDDEAGQEERRGRRSPLGPVLAPLGKQRLDAVEEWPVDQVGVGAVVEGVSEEHLADVDRVAKHGEDGRVAPGPPGLGTVPRLVQPHRQRPGAFSAVGVAVEDDRDERRLVGIGREIAGRRVHVVAEGTRPPTPAATGGLSLHAGDHPVDDGRPLELGEHSEHLDHHPPRGGRRVERLGGRAECDADRVEVFQELGEARTERENRSNW
ncbi:MAG: hypothetical protein M0Z62_09710 [Actinomycetota bacterium]|nr:hypothetical protein [Actinomycetota bacterium]